MQLLRLNSAVDEEFGAVWDIYRSSFPANGQRNLEEQLDLFSRRDYSLFAVKVEESGKGEHVWGMMGVWNLDGFDFIEHFAIDGERRSLGLGSQAMMIRNGAYPTVLEVPSDSKAVRFFERCGFHVAPFEYLRPPGKRKVPVKLQLMSSPIKLDEARFTKLREQIHTAVYGLSKPLM